jgi:hypothetical protein
MPKTSALEFINGPTNINYNGLQLDSEPWRFKKKSLIRILLSPGIISLGLSTFQIGILNYVGYSIALHSFYMTQLFKFWDLISTTI